MNEVLEFLEKVKKEFGGEEVDACPVHGINLCRGRVRVRYGLPMVEDADREAWKLFPYSNEYVGGGCCIDADSPTSAEVKYCPMCRAELAKWRKGRRAQRARGGHIP